MQNHTDLPHVMTAKDIGIFLSISKTKAYDLLNKEGFPTIVIDGTKRVYREDFFNWLDKQKKTN